MLVVRKGEDGVVRVTRDPDFGHADDASNRRDVTVEIETKLFVLL